MAGTILVQYRVEGQTDMSVEYADRLAGESLELLLDDPPEAGTRVEVRVSSPVGGEVVERHGVIGQVGPGRVQIHLEPATAEMETRYQALLRDLSTRDILTEDLIYNG